ncbi:hypothetical protein [Actinoplanes sp. NPDC051851]|uniref:hypothetical protein n=1 Tax=Actinoplanes sp. NPDC051851 TaxID=3154753 RepID=UPI00342555F5
MDQIRTARRSLIAVSAAGRTAVNLGAQRQTGGGGRRAGCGRRRAGGGRRTTRGGRGELVHRLAESGHGIDVRGRHRKHHGERVRADVAEAAALVPPG